jgi:hypothetical protein
MSLTMLLPFLLFLILVACVGWCYADGMWSNAIRLINTVTAALVATNFFEPVANALDGHGSSYTYLWDFLSLWGLFVLTMLVLRVATDQISHVKVKFLRVADRVGSGILSVWIGWVMVCFTLMTLHTAPLSRNFMFEGFQPKEGTMWFNPDHIWLGFMQKESMGAFSRTASDDEAKKYEAGKDDEIDARLCVFDRNANFIPKYSSRRKLLEDYIANSNSLRVNP